MQYLIVPSLNVVLNLFVILCITKRLRTNTKKIFDVGYGAPDVQYWCLFSCYRKFQSFPKKCFFSCCQCEWRHVDYGFVVHECCPLIGRSISKLAQFLLMYVWVYLYMAPSSVYWIILNIGSYSCFDSNSLIFSYFSIASCKSDTCFHQWYLTNA